MWGAKGCRSFTKTLQGECSGAARGPIAEPKEFLQGFARFAVTLVHLHHFVVEDHQLADSGIEAHAFDTLGLPGLGCIQRTHEITLLLKVLPFLIILGIVASLAFCGG